jgi:nucleotide-binding universal stress UspA family protein
MSLETQSAVLPATMTRSGRCVNACDADLIIMGSRGLSDFEALLLGSVAHKVVHYAHCPVLIVR